MVDELVEAPKPPLKLDLACGQGCKDGFVGVDMAPTPAAKYVFNLLKFPWPFEDNSVEEIHCSHFIEHIPMAFIGKDGQYRLVPETHDDQDLFFAFFDECHRILKHFGKMTVFCPASASDRAFQDPTHRRFITDITFNYLSKKWRSDTGLSHYNVKANFGNQLQYSTIPWQKCVAPGEIAAARVAEVQQRMFKHYRNYINDWVCVLMAIKKDVTLPEFEAELKAKNEAK
jgi:hypothetical protein